MAPVDYTPPANPHSLHHEQAAEGRGWTTYTVRPGDSLAKLAIQHRTTISALVARNSIQNPRMVQPGRVIQVPTDAPARSAAPQARKDGRSAAKQRTAAPARHYVEHTLQPGETFVSISRRYHVGYSAIMKANRIADTHGIAAGTVVKVPVSPERAAATPAKASDAQGATAKKASTTKATKKKATNKDTFAGRTYPEAVVKKAEANRARLATAKVPSRSETRDLIRSTARRYGVDPRLALAVGWQESGWNQRRVSPANAVGVMQVMPDTGTWCSNALGRKLDVNDPHDNITCGVLLLRWLTDNADSTDQAAAGYYQGLGGVRRNGMAPDTEQYVRAVKAHMDRF